MCNVSSEIESSILGDTLFMVNHKLNGKFCDLRKADSCKLNFRKYTGDLFLYILP